MFHVCVRNCPATGVPAARRRLVGTALALLVALLAAGAPVRAADIRVLDSLLDSVLESHVDGGYVDYPAIARNARFYKYIEAVAEFDVATLADDDARLAFWINAYNACAIKLIVDGGTPISSMSRIKFFRTTEHRIAGRNIDLREMEHDIIASFDRPLAFFAIVPATYSGPRLRSEAYRADRLAAQLEDNAYDFINDNRKNRFSLAASKAKLSEVFEWHAEQFGEDDAAVLAFVAGYVRDEEKAKALTTGTFEIEYLDYDWSINGRPM